MASLIEKPNDYCEITISLSEEIARNIRETGVAGVYKADGTYCRGRPTLRHSDGRFTLSVKGYDGIGRWVLTSTRRFEWSDPWDDYLRSRTAPSPCPADPRVARNERLGLEQWEYCKWRHQQWQGQWNQTNPFQWSQSSGITVICKTHSS